MTTQFTNSSYRYCGRIFTKVEIEWIRRLIASEPKHTRIELSRIVCDRLQWLRPDGRGKDMSCRVAMLRMHRDGLICLPPPKTRNGNANNRPKLTSLSDFKEQLSLPARAFGKLLLHPVTTSKDSSLLE